MAEAIADQARRMPYYSTFTHITTPPAAELAAKLAQLAPGSLNHVFYGTSGSVANDSAIRIIHFYNNRLGRKPKRKSLPVPMVIMAVLSGDVDDRCCF